MERHSEIDTLQKELDKQRTTLIRVNGRPQRVLSHDLMPRPAEKLLWLMARPVIVEVEDLKDGKGL